MSKLLLNDKPLIVLPSLASVIGLNESIVLQQLHYWLLESKNIKDGEKWVYNTYDDWQGQFPFWSVSTIRRTITKLESLKLIIIGNYNKLKIDNTKWYRIDYKTLEHVSRPSVQNEQTECSKWTDGHSKLNRPLPENTTEITTDKATASPFDFYQQNFGVLNPFMSESIGMWIDDLGEELVIEAMKRTLKQQKNWRYTEGILKDWFKNNIRSVADAQAEENSFTSKRDQRSKNNASSQSNDAYANLF